MGNFLKSQNWQKWGQRMKLFPATVKQQLNNICKENYFLLENKQFSQIIKKSCIGFSSKCKILS